MPTEVTTDTLFQLIGEKEAELVTLRRMNLSLLNANQRLQTEVAQEKYKREVLEAEVESLQSGSSTDYKGEYIEPVSQSEDGTDN